MSKRHDHRQSTWLICGGNVIWCYQCGAWKMNAAPRPGEKNVWHKPSGIGGPNPALKSL